MLPEPWAVLKAFWSLTVSGEIGKHVGCQHVAGLAIEVPKTFAFETHRAKVMRKLKARTIADVVRYAVRNKIIEA